MQPLLVSLGIFVVGVMILSGCWRDYRERTAQAVINDLWDLAFGHVLGVIVGAFLTVVGFALLLTALAPGGVFDYSKRFPFVTFAKPAPSKP